MDDTVKKLGMFQIWHRLPPSHELIASQTLAVEQRWRKDWSGRGHKTSLLPNGSEIERKTG